ncbi:MAG: IS21-like element helper ATPase IstB [Salinisphaera sp.]|nr:IS21-like element helper ATPase IstB [Salinisphaera sp.]
MKTTPEELEQLLLNLRLTTVAAQLPESLAAAEHDGTPVATVLLQLLRAEWQARQQAALDARVKRAKLPEVWTLETFPFKLQTGVRERQIRTLAELDFIPQAENIIFIGETGVGKTGLMSALVLKAVQNGYRARFIKAQDLFDELYASLADRSTRRLIRSLARIDVLAIDEMGYLNIKPEQTNIFFKLMEERHHRRPTLLTTNLPYAAWSDFLGNRSLTEALLSRLRERCHTIIIDGPCLRAQQG